MSADSLLWATWVSFCCDSGFGPVCFSLLFTTYQPSGNLGTYQKPRNLWLAWGTFPISPLQFLPSFREVPCRSPRAALCPSPRETDILNETKKTKHDKTKCSVLLENSRFLGRGWPVHVNPKQRSDHGGLWRTVFTNSPVFLHPPGDRSWLTYPGIWFLERRHPA